jgi:purine-binding chemotaxis protein CheW
MTTEHLLQDAASTRTAVATPFLLHSKAKALSPTEIGVAILLIRLGGRQYGLPLESVERVMPMAQVLSLPDAGDGLLGMLNIHGQVLPVVDAHPRLGLPTPRVAAEQRLVLLRASVPFLMWVDDVEEVVVSSADALSLVPAQRGTPLVTGILRLGEIIVPVLAPAALEPRGSLR